MFSSDIEEEGAALLGNGKGKEDFLVFSQHQLLQYQSHKSLKY